MSGSIPDTVVTAKRPGGAAADMPSLRVDGRDFFGWLKLSVTRSLDQLASAFSLEVTERWARQQEAWPLKVFSPIELRLGRDLILTGHVDTYQASLEAGSRGVQLQGRSLVADLVDCAPPVQGGEFRGATLDAIARALCQPFGITVVVDADVGAAVDLTAIQRQDTVHGFLELLARQRGVLLTDNAQGNLVITRTGSRRSSTTLRQGVNVLRAQGELDGSERFSDYFVLAQRGSAAAYERDDDGEEEEAPGAGVVVAVNGSARDPGVPRYRPTVIMGERAMTAAEAQARAVWEARHAAGRGTRAQITVQGWRDDDGALWEQNTLVPCDIPALQLDAEMLIARVTWQLDQDSATTVLEVGPPEGFTPEPIDKNRRGRGAGAGAAGDQWREVVPAR